MSYAGGNAPLRVTGWCPGCSCEGSRHRRPGPFFGAGATPLRSTCHRGADDEDGVTCGIDDLKYVPGRKYIYTCVNVSDCTVTSRAPGSYTVRSHVPAADPRLGAGRAVVRDGLLHGDDVERCKLPALTGEAAR